MMTNRQARRLLAPALALLIASQARADQLPCEGLTCIGMIPVGLAVLGYIRLTPTPVLIQAMQAVDANDNPTLERLLARHPSLTRLTPAQSETLAVLEADAGRKRIDDLYVLSLSKADSTTKGMIESNIDRSEWNALEVELKTSPGLAAAVDNGYVLLIRAARRGNLEAVRMLLNAGVRADSHRSGALVAARAEDVRQLLLSHGATAPAGGDAGKKDAGQCPTTPAAHSTPG